MRNQLYQEAEIFAQHIVIALDCIKECRTMDRIFGDENCTDLYKTAPIFFKTAYQAMRFRYQIEVSNLFDPKGKRFEIFKNLICKEKLVPERYVDEYKKAYNNAKNDVEVIRERRNKVLAHPDKAYFQNPDRFINQHTFDLDKIEKLLDTMLTICNWMLLHNDHQGITQLYTVNGGDDFRKLTLL